MNKGIQYSKSQLIMCFLRASYELANGSILVNHHVHHHTFVRVSLMLVFRNKAKHTRSTREARAKHARSTLCEHIIAFGAVCHNIITFLIL